MIEITMRNYSAKPLAEMYLAAKRCRTEGDVSQFESDAEEKQKWLVSACIEAGHLSVAEAVNFTFTIRGLPKCNANQLVRHRLCSFWERSGRAVVIGSKEEAGEILKMIQSGNHEGAFKSLRKYFYFLNRRENIVAAALAFEAYHSAIEWGAPTEVARRILPQGEFVEITMRTNFRNLMEISKTRLCRRAEEPIRDVFAGIKEAIRKGPDGEFLAGFLVPKCEAQGRCNEQKSCGHFERLHNLTQENER